MNYWKIKNRILFLTILLSGLGFNSVLSQSIPLEYLKSIQFNTGTIMVDKVNQPAQSVSIYGDIKEIEKDWKKYTRQELSLSWKKSRTYLRASNEKSKTFSENPVLLYSSLNMQNNITVLSISISDGNGNFARDNFMQKEWNSAKSLLLDFTKSFYISKIDDDLIKLKKDISAKENARNKLMTEREKIENNTIRSSKNLTQEQQNILKSREKIEKEQKNLLKTEKKIAERQTGKKEGDNELEKLRLEKEEINSNIQSLMESIATGESAINQHSDEIEENNRQKQQIDSEIQSILTELEGLNGLTLALEGYKSFLSKK